MVLTDDNHAVARKLKELEEQVADLQEGARSDESPNILISASDEFATGDSVAAVIEREIEPLRYQDSDTGYRISAYSHDDR